MPEQIRENRTFELKPTFRYQKDLKEVYCHNCRIFSVQEVYDFRSTSWRPYCPNCCEEIPIIQPQIYPDISKVIIWKHRTDPNRIDELF